MKALWNDLSLSVADWVSEVLVMKALWKDLSLSVTDWVSEVLVAKALWDLSLSVTG